MRGAVCTNMGIGLAVKTVKIRKMERLAEQNLSRFNELRSRIYLAISVIINYSYVIMRKVIIKIKQDLQGGKPLRYRNIALMVLAAMGAGLFLGGCSTEYYKEDADKEVYRIIDEKWQGDFGSKANFRISDVTAGPNDVQVAPVNAVTGILGLSETVALATAHSRDYQNQRESLYLSALSLTSDRHDFAPIFSGLFGGDYTRSANNESVSLDAGLGLNLLLADGARIGLNLATDWFRYLTGDPGTSLGSVLSATVSQPLLRGAGRKIVQENLTQAERDVLYDIRAFNRYRKEFVVNIVSQYYNVIESRDEVKNAEENYDSLSYIHERMTMMAEAGRVEPLRADETQQSKLEAWDRYIGAQESYKQQLDRFKITLGLPTEADIELDSGELTALEAIEIVDPNYDVDELVEIALENRLDLLNNRDQVDDADRKIAIAADNLGVELNLIGSAGASSGDGTEFTRIQFDEGTYSLGFDGDLNLDRLSERNSYRQSLISLSRQKRAYERAVDDVIFDVRQAYRDLGEAAFRYRIRQMSLELARQRVEGESLKLQAGRAVTRDLLDAQSDLLDAQNNRTTALVSYTVAKLNFYRDLGLLQVRPDGLWEYQELWSRKTKKTTENDSKASLF
jgi:outer membrane protein TolC